MVELHAESVVRRHQAVAPVRVADIARDLGINVYLDELPSKVSGILRRDAKLGGTSGYVILVNKAHPANRRRFTVAHELAHFILHRERVRDGITDDEFYRALPGPLEREANEYAGGILMPWNLINRLQDGGITELADLARNLHVSKQALAIRLGLPYDQFWD